MKGTGWQLDKSEFGPVVVSEKQQFYSSQTHPFGCHLTLTSALVSKHYFCIQHIPNLTMKYQRERLRGPTKKDDLWLPLKKK